MDVRKTFTDAGYITVGLGVMGFQQAQVRAPAAPASACSDAGDCVAGRAREPAGPGRTRRVAASTLTAREAKDRAEGTVHADRVARAGHRDRGHDARRARRRAGAGDRRPSCPSGSRRRSSPSPRACASASPAPPDHPVTDPLRRARPSIGAAVRLRDAAPPSRRDARRLACRACSRPWPAASAPPGSSPASSARSRPPTSSRSSTPPTTRSSTACTSPPTSTRSPTRSPARRTPRRAGASRARRSRRSKRCSATSADTWFRLGDKDLATHLYRTQRLRAGRARCRRCTAEIARGVGLEVRLLPMTDDRGPDPHHASATPTARQRELAMQEWFVRERAEPEVTRVRLRRRRRGARPRPACSTRCARADTVLICPSNPVISIGPILAVPGIRDALARPPRPGRRGQPDRRRRAGEGSGRPADAARSASRCRASASPGRTPSSAARS